jgi:hypothetical protein
MINRVKLELTLDAQDKRSLVLALERLEEWIQSGAMAHKTPDFGIRNKTLFNMEYKITPISIPENEEEISYGNE